MSKISEIVAKISKEELQRLKSIKGEIIGTGFIEDIKFILDQKGEAGLKKIEEAQKELGCPKYSEIENFKWYPLGCYFISFLIAKELFGWDEKKFRKMGANAVKISLVAKIMMRYFISIRRTFEETSRYWRMYLTVGKLEPIEINEKERYLLLSLKDFPGHQLFCRYLEGLIEQVTSYTIKKPKCQEVKCPLLGEGRDHVFKLSWEK